MEHYSLRFWFAGMVFDIPTILMMVLTSLIVFFLIIGLTRKLTAGVPTGGQNFLEWVVDFVTGIAQNFMDAKTASKFVALALTLFLYIFIGNQLGLVLNVITTHHGELSPKVVEMMAVSGTPETAAEKAEHIKEEAAHGEHGVGTETTETFG